MSDVRDLRPEELQYLGSPGNSHECFDAVSLLLGRGRRLPHALLLTSLAAHAFILTDEFGYHFAIKSGFLSGYVGAGPGALADVLTVLDVHGADIKEVLVPPEVIHALNRCALTKKHIETIRKARPPEGSRWRSYIYDQYDYREAEAYAHARHAEHMPLGIIDFRLNDLVQSFFRQPDQAILTGFRRLEDIVRARLGGHDLQAHRVFAAAFQGSESPLTWSDIDASEHIGRANLFTGAYQAYRNPRAHREKVEDHKEVLSEFLMLNLLFCLERSAVLRTDAAKQE